MSLKRQPPEFYCTPEYLAAIDSLESEIAVAQAMGGYGNFYGSYKDQVLASLRELFTYHDGHLYWVIHLERGYPVAGARAGTVSGRGRHKHISIKMGGRTFSAAGLIYMYHTGTRPNSVRHINYNTLDNRIENLAAKGDPRLKALPHERATPRREGRGYGVRGVRAERGSRRA